MNVMKNWGCLNKIKLVDILLAGRPYFIFHPVLLPSRYFFGYFSPKPRIAKSPYSIDNVKYMIYNEEKMFIIGYKIY